MVKMIIRTCSGATKELHAKLKGKPTTELKITCCEASTEFAAKLALSSQQSYEELQAKLKNEPTAKLQSLLRS